MAKLPTGYGPAAPAGGAVVYAKGKTRRRAARILRKKKGGYRAFVGAFMKKTPGSTIADAAKAWSAQKA